MLKNAVCIVTGGTTGLGRAAVQRIIASGGKVAYLARKEVDDPTLVNNNSKFLKCDVSDEAQCQEAINETIKHFGPITAVVNSAGYASAIKVYDKKKDKVHSLKEFTDMWKVNVQGTFNMNRLATQAMFKHTPEVEGERGVLINVSSIAGYEGQSGQVAYSMTKGALHGMTLAWARDTAPLAVRCVTVAPGVFPSPLLQEALPQKLQDAIKADVPTGRRFGEPEEFASLIEHIITNRYINGETIRIDGALRLR